MTPGLLWEEHRDEAARDGLVPRSHDAFCRGHEAFVAARGAASHLEHKPGQVMEVDRGGTPMWLTDEGTGESTRCRLFVATLPYSQHGCVEATPGLRTAGYKDHDSTFYRPRSRPHRPVMHGAPTTRAPCQSLAQDHSQPSSAMRLRMDSLPSMCIILELYTTRSNAKSYVMRSPGRRARPGRSNAPANFA